MWIGLLGPGAALPNEKRHIPLNVDSLSRLIADSRRQRNYAQKELARLAGVSQTWISLVERGRARMDLALLLRVLEALDLRVALKVELPSRLDGVVEDDGRLHVSDGSG